MKNSKSNNLVHIEMGDGALVQARLPNGPALIALSTSHGCCIVKLGESAGTDSKQLPPG